jgi:hypothetical protein
LLLILIIFNSNNSSQEPSNSQWAHDLHESLLETQATGGGNSNQAASHKQQNRPTKNFSTTQLLGKVPVRVYLPGMTEPKTFPDLAVNRYTKLPTHRPPLRRDKPVRVFLPAHPIKYIFPALDRSFIFIPRNLRPNQQGFGKSRAKVLGSIGGYSSRRTSIYGGSMYSPSVAMSRRSSIARESVMASPAGSMFSSRPVVRLPGSHHHHPSASVHGHSSASGTPFMGAGPFAPPRRENWPVNLQMHQPRPQKTISVTGLEFPAHAHNLSHPESLDPLYNMQQQPFHHQIPPQMNSYQDPSYAHHTRQQSYPNTQQAGTPLSNIPERAIHAQPFQPFAPYPQPYYYPQQPGPYQQPPMFVPQQHQGYMMQPDGSSGGPPGQGPGGVGGMIAHEQNGMVYYYDPTQMSASGQQEDYQPPPQHQQGYQMPVMMPAPQAQAEGYYYPPQAGYYPPQ